MGEHQKVKPKLGFYPGPHLSNKTAAVPVLLPLHPHTHTSSGRSGSRCREGTLHAGELVKVEGVLLVSVTALEQLC